MSFCSNQSNFPPIVYLWNRLSMEIPSWEYRCDNYIYVITLLAAPRDFTSVKLYYKAFPQIMRLSGSRFCIEPK